MWYLYTLPVAFAIFLYIEYKEAGNLSNPAYWISAAFGACIWPGSLVAYIIDRQSKS